MPCATLSAMNSARQLAHDLIDRLPETQLSALVRYLKEIIDPVPSALNNAPIDDEPESNDEWRAVEESRRWLDNNQGRGVPHDEAMRHLDLT